MTNRLQVVLARLYKSEINVSITTMWDGGWDVKLGDALNGFDAETTIFVPIRAVGSYTIKEIELGLGWVADWLDMKAREHYRESMYARTAYCCYIDFALSEDGELCGADAEFEIRAVRSIPESPYVGIAGPDIYSDDTHACEAHVGELLSFQPEAVERSNIYWEVRSLAPAAFPNTTKAKV